MAIGGFTITLSTVMIWIKNLLYVPAFFMGLGMSNDMATSSTILIYLMCLDMMTGVIAVWKAEGGSAIKSRIGIAGILSKLTALLIPLTVAMVSSGLHMNLTGLVAGSLYMLILAEGFSVIGNIGTIKTGKKMPEFDVVSLLVKSIRKVFLTLLEKGKL